jgi:hypothetical protein
MLDQRLVPESGMLAEEKKALIAGKWFCDKARRVLQPPETDDRVRPVGPEISRKRQKRSK